MPRSLRPSVKRLATRGHLDVWVTDASEVVVQVKMWKPKWWTYCKVQPANIVSRVSNVYVATHII